MHSTPPWTDATRARQVRAHPNSIELNLDPPHLAARMRTDRRPLCGFGVNPQMHPCGCSPAPAWLGTRTPRIHDLRWIQASRTGRFLGLFADEWGSEVGGG